MSNVIVAHSRRGAPEAHDMRFTTTGDAKSLIVLELLAAGGQQALRALLDSGASSNFVRLKTLEESYLKYSEKDIPPTKVHVRLATGKVVSVKKRVVELDYSLDGLTLHDEFIVLDLDDKFDVILGMPWLMAHDPLVDWRAGTLQLKEERQEDESLDATTSLEQHVLVAEQEDGASGAASLCTRPFACESTQEHGPSGLVDSSNEDARATTTQSVSTRCGDAHNEVRSPSESAHSHADSRPQDQIGLVHTARRQGSTVEEDSRPSSQTGELAAAVPHWFHARYCGRSWGDTGVGNGPHRSMPIRRDECAHEDRRVRRDERAKEDQGHSLASLSQAELDSAVTELATAMSVPLADSLQQDSDGNSRVGLHSADAAARGHAKAMEDLARSIPQDDVQQETLNVMVNDGVRVGVSTLTLESPPQTAAELVKLPVLDHKRLLRDVRKGRITQLCVITTADDRAELGSALTGADVDVRTSSTMDESVLSEHEATRAERYAAQSWKALEANPLYGLLREYEDVFPEEIPCELPKDRGIRHEIVLKPGTKYCVTRQWPLPRDQVKAIDDFFESRLKAGHVRESLSPHSSPTFCVKKATGGWRIVHAFNKLNAATVPAQTPIPRKDVILDSMQGSTIFSALDLRDGFYQVLVREEDIPLTAVSTPSGMLWEWLVMPQGLTNAPATFNRCVTHLLRSVRAFAPSYFDDVFVHSKASNGLTDVDQHRVHVRAVLELMRKHKLYANLKKCVFAAPEIPVLGCFVSKDGVRPDPEKIRVIREWPTPNNVKELRQFLGMATYLHKYSQGFAQRALPLTAMLRKDATWEWTDEEQRAFDSIKRSLIEAPVLAIADQDKPFFVVCDASDNAIGCALMQRDSDDRERVISYESRQLKSAERNYPVHDKELLAMKYALAKYRVYLLGDRPFVVYTDHASLRTAINSPHISQRMARWLSFFAEFNFTVEYKPGRFNVIADALSRRPVGSTPSQDACATAVVTQPTSSLLDDVRKACARDKDTVTLMAHLSAPSEQTLPALSKVQRASLHRYKADDGLLWYRAVADDEYAVVVPDDEDLRLRILYEYHDAPASGHRGREKTYASLRRDFYWRHQYKYVRKYVQRCEICQRAKSSPGMQAPLHPLPVPAECWKSVSMDFVFGLPVDKQGRNGVLVFVDRFSKMVHLAAVPETITAEASARVFMREVFRLHGMPDEIVSDRDPRFTAAFWQAVFRQLGTRLRMSTSDHPQTDGQTERTNRVLEEILRAYAHSFESWSMHLVMAEFAINNAVHASTGLTPFYVNGLRHPRLPTLLGLRPSSDAEDRPGTAIDRVVDRTVSPDQDTCDDSLSSHHEPSGLLPERFEDMPSGRLPERSEDMALDSVMTRAQAKRARESARDADSSMHNEASTTVPEPVSLDTSATVPHVAPDFRQRPKVNRIAASVVDFTQQREAVLRFVQDAIASAADRQKANTDKNGRVNDLSFNLGEQVMLSTDNLPEHAVSVEGSSKLLPKFIGPFRIVKRNGEAYTLDLPSVMRTHPTFYVGRLRPYRGRYEPSSPSGPLPLGHPDGSVAELQYPSGQRWPGPASQGPRAAAGACPSPRQAQSSGSRQSSRAQHAQAAPEEPRSSDLRAQAPQPSLAAEIFPPPPPPLKDSTGAQRWIVDRLVDHRDQRLGRSTSPRRQYLVHWLGYPSTHDTWEYRDDLVEDIPDEVRAYEREHRL